MVLQNCSVNVNIPLPKKKKREEKESKMMYKNKSSPRKLGGGGRYCGDWFCWGHSTRTLLFVVGKASDNANILPTSQYTKAATFHLFWENTGSSPHFLREYRITTYPERIPDYHDISGFHCRALDVTEMQLYSNTESVVLDDRAPVTLPSVHCVCALIPYWLPEGSFSFRGYHSDSDFDE